MNNENTRVNRSRRSAVLRALAALPSATRAQGFAPVQLLIVALVAIPILGLAFSAVGQERPVHATMPPALGANATLSEIEACVTRNLPDAAGVIDFSVEAVDRTGVVTASRAEIRWRNDDAELTQVLLRVSEPAKTAGTALLIVDRKSDQPEFFVRLPELPKVKRVRSKRLRGPVLGTDFSYEDLDHMRDPLDRTHLELVGLSEIEGRPAWLLETVPDPEDGSEYARVLTYVDQGSCLPIQIDLFEEDEELRKRLRAPYEEIRTVGTSHLPHVFVMEDLRRETHTVIRIERFDSSQDLPADQFTKSALQASSPAAVAR